MEPIIMRCKQCRFALLSYPETRVETSHGSLVTDTQGFGVSLSSEKCTSGVWFLPEHHMPSWINSNLEKGGWVKGKIQCPNCDGRLGSYNFVSGMKCGCGMQIVVTPIHIVKSKVDFFIPPAPSPEVESVLTPNEKPDTDIIGEELPTPQSSLQNV